MSQSQNKERLRALTPIAAVQAWLDGDFGMDDEPALIFAMRKDPRIVATDDDIMDAMCDVMDAGLDAAACLEQLASLR
jgi:hypothetical protein